MLKPPSVKLIIHLRVYVVNVSLCLSICLYSITICLWRSWSSSSESTLDPNSETEWRPSESRWRRMSILWRWFTRGLLLDLSALVSCTLSLRYHLCFLFCSKLIYCFYFLLLLNLDMSLRASCSRLIFVFLKILGIRNLHGVA